MRKKLVQKRLQLSEMLIRLMMNLSLKENNEGQKRRNDGSVYNFISQKQKQNQWNDSIYRKKLIKH
jgi:hypothetical protein